MTETSQTKRIRRRGILLVDDNTDFTALFKDFLLAQSPGGWLVHTADHYAPALSCLKGNQIDLVVLDLNLPVMDGLQFLALLKRTFPAIPVVMLTAVATPENRATSLKAGAALFLDKSEIAGDFAKIYAALESIASAPTEGFRGMLRQVGLPDVLQMECLGRKSSVLEVASREDNGKIFIEDGTIVHAETQALQGEQALFRLLSLSGGEFQLKPFSQPPRRTIDGSWESLLMESARLRDEASANETPVSAPAAETKTKLDAAGAQPPRAIREIVLCSGSGELLYEWQAQNVDRRIQLLELLFNISASIGKTPGLERGDRVEVQSPEGRVVFLLQPDRRVLIKSVAKE